MFVNEFRCFKFHIAANSQSQFKIPGVPPNQCADNDGHNTDTIDALTLIVPVILKYSDASPEERNEKVILIVKL